MVTRIRIEAEGSSVEDVERQLNDATHRIAFSDDNPAQHGDHVIARDPNEPRDGDTAYKGRLVVHPPEGWI